MLNNPDILLFSTLLSLLERYPTLRFACSQPALYAAVKRLDTELYARVKARIAAGQWEVAGSAWVEPDCNLSSGESLVRQILHGKNFFLDEFGIETHDFWLPDASAAAASLPQILKRARIDYVLLRTAQRPQAATPPPPAFLWQGIEGTQTLTRLLSSGSAEGDSPQEFARLSLDSLAPSGQDNEEPAPDAPANVRRLQELEDAPLVITESLRAFYRRAEESTDTLGVWVGELTPPGGGSVHTAQVRRSRRAELALRAAEFLSVVSPAGLAAYPQDSLDRLWKTTLLRQRRTALSGAPAGEIPDAEQDARVVRDAEAILEEARGALAAAVNTRGVKRPILVVSSLSHFANEVVETPLRAGENPVTAIGPEGDAVAVQIVSDAEGERSALFVAKNTPLHGYAIWDLNATTVPVDDEEDAVTASRTHLENASLRVEFDAVTGLITRLFDRDNEREILHETYTVQSNGRRDLNAPQCANQLTLHRDGPFDAEGSDAGGLPPAQPLTALQSVTVVEAGPVRGAIRFERLVGSSHIVQTVRLTTGSMRLDFETEADWQETDASLKVAFPVAINSSRAAYEIPYGYVEHPTYRPVSADSADAEVCTQRWADLSEGNYGVALLNDGLSGCEIQGDTLRLTLLRSPQASEPGADRRAHRFTYALLPHNGDFREGEVVENAAALNSPPSASAPPANRPGPLPLERSFFEVDSAAVFIETIKRAEKEPAVIVRLYEGHNTRGTVTLTTTLPVRSAWYCDLMEQSLAEIPVSGGEMLLPILPFEIVTVKLLL